MKYSILVAAFAVCSLTAFAGNVISVPADCATVADAVAAASAGDEIVLAEGTYTVSAVLQLAAGVNMRGVSGDWKDVTVTTVGNACALLEMRTGSTVSAITFAGGARQSVKLSGGTLVNCRVTGARTSASHTFGAGVYNDNGQVLDCLIDNNQCVYHFTGCGIYQQGADALIDRCVITNNTATLVYGNRNGSDGRVGLGAALKGGLIRNSLIAWNSTPKCEAASYVGASGVALYGGSMVNCTVMFNTFGTTDNKALCGVTVEGSSTARNSIVVDNATENRRDSAANAFADSSAHYANYDHCLIANPNGGETDCIDFATIEFFRQPDGLPRLYSGSALVDAGVTDAWAYGATDLAGLPRVMGTDIDIGANEYQPPAFSCTFTADRTRGFDSLTAVLTPHPEGDAEGATYYWDLDGDGTAETVRHDANAFSVTYDELGTVTVTLWATNAAETAGATFSMELTVLPSVIPVDADHSLEDALDAADTGCSIVIASGEYAYAAPISVTKGVTIRSATGKADDDRLVGSGNGCLITVSHSGAVVENVTIARGAPGVCLEAGVLRDCRITACTGTCSTAGCKNTGGTIERCVFDRNAVCRVVDGVAFCVSGENALAKECIVTNNGSYAIGGEQVYGNNNHGASRGGMVAAHGGATIRNTLVAFNDMGRYSHLTAGKRNSFAVALTGPSRLENCTVVSNCYDYGYENDTPAVTNGTEAAAVFVQMTEFDSGSPTIVNCAVADNFRRADGREIDFLFSSDGLKGRLSNVATRGVAGLSEDCVAFEKGDILYGRGRFVVPVASGLVSKGAPLDWHEGGC